MDINTEDEIIKKAKHKKNGCYRHKGIAYRVADGYVTHFADYGTILERCMGFNVVVSQYDYSINSDEVGQKILKRI